METIVEKINKSAIKFLAPLTPLETYKTIVKEAVKLFDADYGNVILEQNGELKRVYASVKMAYGTKNRKNGNTYKSYIEQKVIVAPISEIGLHHPEMAAFGVKWTIFIPLSYQKHPIGVLTINTKKPQRIPSNQYGFFKLFGSLVSLAIIKTKALDETSKALEVRDLFISLASHELKTPLTSINAYIQLIKRRVDTKKEVPASLVNNLAQESVRLTNLIKELLEINQVKSGTFNFNWTVCSCGEIIDRAINNFRVTRPDRKIRFINKLESKPDYVVGDFDKLLQVMVNLLNNAIKFSESNSTIVITLKENLTDCIIFVKDHGIGIAKDDIPHIFKDFYKGSHKREGMGLGLFLTKHIIDSHKGVISVKSEERNGTTVELRLPKIAVV